MEQGPREVVALPLEEDTGRYEVWSLTASPYGDGKQQEAGGHLPGLARQREWQQQPHLSRQQRACPAVTSSSARADGACL